MYKCIVSRRVGLKYGVSPSGHYIYGLIVDYVDTCCLIQASDFITDKTILHLCVLTLVDGCIIYYGVSTRVVGRNCNLREIDY